MHCELLLGGQTWWEDMHIQNYENSKACKKIKKPLKVQYIVRSMLKVSKMPRCVHRTKT